MIGNRAVARLLLRVALSHIRTTCMALRSIIAVTSININTSNNIIISNKEQAVESPFPRICSGETVYPLLRRHRCTATHQGWSFPPVLACRR